MVRLVFEVGSEEEDKHDGKGNGGLEINVE